MRYLFFTLLGFFGPALFMFLLRLIWYRIRYQLLIRKHEPEIIDVTPRPEKGFSRRFIFSWIAISLISTGLLIWQMDNSPAEQKTYIPAHIDSEGNFVPAQTLKAPEEK